MGRRQSHFYPGPHPSRRKSEQQASSQERSHSATRNGTNPQPFRLKAAGIGLGPDDRHTLCAADSLAEAFRQLGHYADARRLDEDTLARCRRVLGDDHPSTLDSANNLADDLRALGEIQVARDLHEDNLRRRRRVLGVDHRNTLDSACNLAADLRALGEIQAARDLDEDTLAPTPPDRRK